MNARHRIVRATLLPIATMVALVARSLSAVAQVCPTNEPSISCKKVEVTCAKVPGYRLSGCNGGVVTTIPLLGGLTIFHNSYGSPRASAGIGQGWRLMGAIEDNRGSPLLRAASGDVTYFVSATPVGAASTVYESAEKMRGDLRRLLPGANGGWQLLEPNGATTWYTYSDGQRWLPKSYVDATGLTSTYEYQLGGSIPSSIQVPGAPTIFLNVSNGVLRGVTYRGMTMWLMYNALGQLYEIRNPDGTSQTITYNSLGLIAGITNPFHRTQRYHYELQPDQTAVISSVKDFKGRTYRFSYTKDQTRVRHPGAAERITWATSKAPAPNNKYPAKTEQYRLKTKQPIEGGLPTPLNPTNAQYSTVQTIQVDEIGRPIAITDEANNLTRIYYGMRGECRDAAVATSYPFPTCVVLGDGRAVKTERDSLKNYIPTRITRFSPSAQLLSTTALTWTSHPSKSPLISPLLASLTTTANFSRGGKAGPVVTRSLRSSYKPGRVVPSQIDTSDVSTYAWDTSKALLTQALYPNGSSQAWSYDPSGDLTSYTQDGITTTVTRSIQKDDTRLSTLANKAGTSASTRNGSGTRSSQLISILVSNGTRGSYNYTPIDGDRAAGGDSITAAGESTLPYESSGATDFNEDGTTTNTCSCNSLAGVCITKCNCKPDGTGCEENCERTCSMVNDEDDSSDTPVPELGRLDIEVVGDGFGRVLALDGHEMCAKPGVPDARCEYEGIPIGSTVPLIGQGINESTFAAWEKPAECREWTVATHEPTNPCLVPMNLNPQLVRAKFDACRRDGQKISGNQQCCSDAPLCGGRCGCPSGQTCDQSNPDPSKWSCSCNPQCAPLACGGSDGCGGTCRCPEKFRCSGGQCIYDDGCVKQCAGKVCGDDGCKGSCGTCEGGKSCVNGQCQAPPPVVPTATATATATPTPSVTPTPRPTDTPTCQRQCDGKVCGSDGCGGSCGNCPAGQSCTSAGQCAGASCRTAGMTCSNATSTTPCCPGLICTAAGVCRASGGVPGGSL